MPVIMGTYSMGTTATSGGQAFRRVPTGNWPARCIDVLDLGTQMIEWQGVAKPQHKIQIGWEVFGEDDAGVPLTIEVDGKEMPLTIQKRYTLSLNDKAGLRRDLEAWRGKPFSAEELKGFDVSKLLGAYCLLNIIEEDSANGKTYSNIQSIAPMLKGMPKPAAVHPLRHFDIDKPDMKMFESFYAKLQETIQSAAEWKPLAAAPAAQKLPAESIPFDDMGDDQPF